MAQQQAEQQIQPQRSYRARQLDLSRPLEIVRDESLLDAVEVARDVVHNHQALDADNEKPKMVNVGGSKKAKEIPTPITLDVETYRVDYLPCFNPRNTYIRGKGGGVYEDKSFVEYDLDSEDFKWLETNLNTDAQIRLSPERLEQCLYKLEMLNAAKLDSVFQGTTERRSQAACSSTEYLTKADALAMLEESCGGRDKIRDAIYEYWKKKRADRGKPLLRRLEAPVNYNNPNPMLTFRSRGEVRARPQTRRRRENNPDSLDKLTMISDNIKQALELFELLIRRERKKRDLIYANIDRQQLFLVEALKDKSKQEEFMNQIKVKQNERKRPVGFEDLPDAAPGTTNKLLSFKMTNIRNGRGKSSYILGEDPLINAVAMLPQEPVVSKELDLLPREYSLMDGTTVRLGRLGRTIVDRCELLDSTKVDPLWKVVSGMEKHPENSIFGMWKDRVDLADKKLTKSNFEQK
jgi:hypothetical protein